MDASRCGGAEMTQDNTRPYFTIDELNAWANEKLKQAWRNAALRLGEELSSVGPNGYYDMTPEQWLDWALEQAPKATLPRPWASLTDDDIDQGLIRANYLMQNAHAWRDGVEWASKQLQEKNT